MKQSEKYLKIKETIEKVLSSSERDLAHYGTVLYEQLKTVDFKEDFEGNIEEELIMTRNLIGSQSYNPNRETQRAIKDQLEYLLKIIKSDD